jgi:hypothetical protein
MCVVYICRSTCVWSFTASTLTDWLYTFVWSCIHVWYSCGLVKSYFSSFWRKKKIEILFVVVLRTPQRMRRFACLQDCLLTLKWHLAPPRIPTHSHREHHCPHSHSSCSWLHPANLLPNVPIPLRCIFLDHRHTTSGKPRVSWMRHITPLSIALTLDVHLVFLPLTHG